MSTVSELSLDAIFDETMTDEGQMSRFDADVWPELRHPDFDSAVDELINLLEKKKGRKYDTPAAS